MKIEAQEGGEENMKALKGYKRDYSMFRPDFSGKKMYENPCTVYSDLEERLLHQLPYVEMGNKKIAGKVMIGEFPVKVWYSLQDCFYGNWGNTSTVVRVDVKGIQFIAGNQDDLHACEPYDYSTGGMKPLDWKVAKDFNIGKVTFSMPNHKSSHKMKTSNPHVVNIDTVEMIVHEKNINSWIDNYRKLFVNQPFRITAEVIEMFDKDSEKLPEMESDVLWAEICREAVK